MEVSTQSVRLCLYQIVIALWMLNVYETICHVFWWTFSFTYTQYWPTLSLCWLETRETLEPKQREAFLEDAHLTIPTIFASSLRNIQRVQAGALSSHQLVLTYSLAWDVCRNHGVRIEMPIWKGKETPAGSALSTIFEMLHMHCWQEAFKYPTLSMSPDARYIMPFTLTPSRHS